MVNAIPEGYPRVTPYLAVVRDDEVGFDPAETELWGRRMRADWAGFARTGRIETGTVDGLMTVRAGDEV